MYFNARMMTRPAVVFPDDIEVPISNTTGMSSGRGAAGTTKSRIETLRPPRVT